MKLSNEMKWYHEINGDIRLTFNFLGKVLINVDKCYPNNYKNNNKMCNNNALKLFKSLGI